MATNVFDQFDAPSAKVETEDQGPPLGPNGEPLNLPLNSGAANIYSNNAPEIKNIFDQFDSPAQTDKQVLAQPTPTPEQTGKVINLPAMPSKEQNVFDKALEQYPKLKDANAVGLMSTNDPDGANMLESWPAGETGTPERPRPKELPSDKLGVQIYSDKTTPNDVAADIVSHSLVKTDPNLKATYDQFASSITPDQKDFLMGDYEQEVKQATLSGGEKPPAFDQWMQQVGIPSAFRGYAFGQYDQKAQQQFGYTDQQKQLLGSVNPYLQGQPTKRPVGFIEGAGRGLVGGLAKANELMAQGVGVFPYMEDKTLQAFGVDSNIYNRYMKAVHATGLGKPGVEAEAIKPSEYLTTGGQIGQGLGEMTSSLPYMIGSGGVGAEATTAQEAFQVVKPLMTPIRQGIQSMLPMATQAGAETVQQSAQQGDNPVTQAAKGIASATATAVTGAIPLSMRSKIANPLARFLEQGAYGYITGLGVGESQKVVDSWINGKPYIPSSWKDMAIQAIPMAFMTGLFGVIHAPEPQRKVLPEPAPEVAPSNVAGVNEKEAQITANADALHKTPPVTQEQKTSLQEELNKKTLETPEEKAKIRDQELSSKWDEMMSHPEGSPEREKAFQEYIDISSGKVKPTETSQAKPTAETPVAEAQPETTNATKTGEVKESNQPEHPNRDETRQATETSSGDSTVTGEKVQEEVIGKTLLPEDRLFISDLSKDAKEKIISVGAASPEEFMQRYASIGAKSILDGNTTLEDFARDIVKEIPSIPKDQIPEIFERSKQLINDFETATGGKVPVEQKPKEKKETIEINPKTELKKSLRSQEKAGEAGYKRGTKEAWSQAKEIIGNLKNQISNSITKAQALAEHLRGQEIGAKIGIDAMRRRVASADKILRLDQENIRKNLIDLVNRVLPPNERGRFLNRITKAMERQSIFKADPMKMYQREAQLTGVILRHADNVYKKGIINDIKGIFDKAISAKNIDVRYKSLIKDFFKGLEFTGMTKAKQEELMKRKADLDESISAGKGSGLSKEASDELERLNRLPLKDMPIGALEQLKEQVQRVFDEGKSALAITKAEQADQKTKLLDEMKKSDSNPWTKKTGKFTDADQVEKFEMIRNFNNKIIAVQNQLGTLDIAALPTDAAIEWLDGNNGNYTGFLQKNFNGNVDLGYNGYSAEGNAIRENISKITKEEKISLSGNVMGKISIYANLQQEGGRERMIESGSTSPESIARVEKSGLTSGEMRLYNAMRGHFERLFPDVVEIMRNLYNVEMKRVENYWPMPRDWEKFNELRQTQIAPDPVTGNIYDERSVVDQFLFSTNQPQRTTTKVEQGLTISRVKGAETPIKLSAFNDFNTAIDNMLFIKHLQPVLKQLGEIARTDEFNEKYGTAGQKYILDWMDTIARKGTGVNTIAFLDGLRKNISAGIIGFKPSSQLKHTSFIPYAMYHTGGAQWYVRGLFAARTKQGQEWIKNNAAEIAGRAGSDVSVSELQGGKGLLGGIRSKYSKYAFALVRAIDHENSSTTMLGRYMYELDKRGLDWSNFDKYPVVEDAQKSALVRMRRAVASPGYKDIPLLLSRGMGVGGSTSIAKTVFQFQNPQLDQWSNVRVDLLGSLQQKQYGRAFGLGTAIATSSAIEAGVHVGVGAGMALIGGGIYGMLTGKTQKKKEKDIPEEIAKEYAKNFLTKMPLTPQLWNILEYHQFRQSGIPIVDFPVSTASEAAEAFTAKSEEARKGHFIQAVGNVVTGLTGIPGTQTITSGIKALAVDPELKKKQAIQAAESTRKANQQQKKSSSGVEKIGRIKIIKGVGTIK